VLYRSPLKLNLEKRFVLAMKSYSIACGIVSALLLTGCGGPKPQSENAAPKNEPTKSAAGTPPSVDEANAGTISGKVSFTGAKPVMRTIDMSATPACAKEHGPVKSEEIVVNDNGTLKYVFVWVKSGVPEKSWAAPSGPVTLDQRGCMYEPHVIGVMVDQDVKFANSDPTNHNIHPLPRINAEWNESQPPKGSELVKRFSKQEIMMPVKCNVHPWMRAYIGVVSHPFFAVTGDDGLFKIKGLPAGKYTVEAWQERYGTKDIEVTLAPKEDKVVDFSYSSKP
jgi:plastocyanin